MFDVSRQLAASTILLPAPMARAFYYAGEAESRFIRYFIVDTTPPPISLRRHDYHLPHFFILTSAHGVAKLSRSAQAQNNISSDGRLIIFTSRRR